MARFALTGGRNRAVRDAIRTAQQAAEHTTAHPRLTARCADVPNQTSELPG
jgi:hypothetical protein